MSTSRPAVRRLAFGGVAELYEQVRPSYPQAMVDEIVAYAGLERNARILEIGAGTGKATRLFAPFCDELVALEPSAEMARIAVRTCLGFGSVTVIQAEFEGWPLPPDRFGLVISAQAWHWIEPEVRYIKARAALRAGGALAAFWSHPDWSDSPLRTALQDAYRESAPEFDPAGPMHPSSARGDLVRDWDAEIAAAPGFEAPELREFRWSRSYSAEDYVRLLATHSDHVVLEPRIRERLLARVAEVIEQHGGEIEVLYVTRLCLARAA